MHPSLWRQAQLCGKQGLFQVTDGIYQLRGLDLFNMTMVEGSSGVIVIDPLISAECAAAGLALYRKNRGARGYYGSVSHNVKAIYQRYMGWFDGHPPSLWAHPPQAAAVRYVDVIGGPQGVPDKAQAYADDGDLRFAAELLKHAVFADPDDYAAREALADVYQRLGYGAENATWRSFYRPGRWNCARGSSRRRFPGHRLALHRRQDDRAAGPVQRGADPDREPAPPGHR